MPGNIITFLTCSWISEDTREAVVFEELLDQCHKINYNEAVKYEITVDDRLGFAESVVRDAEATTEMCVVAALYVATDLQIRPEKAYRYSPDDTRIVYTDNLLDPGQLPGASKVLQAKYWLREDLHERLFNALKEIEDRGEGDDGCVAQFLAIF